MAKKGDTYGCRVPKDEPRRGCGGGAKVVDIKRLEKRVEKLEQKATHKPAAKPARKAKK